MIKYACEECGVEMESPDSLAGQRENCPECGAENWVPARSVVYERDKQARPNVALASVAEEAGLKVVSVASRYSDQPEENVITISRVGDAECPYRYYKNYVETPRQEKPFESIELGIGQFFHSYVAAHFRQIMAEARPVELNDEISVDELLRAFRMSFLWEGKLRRPYRIVQPDHSVADFEERLRYVAVNFNMFLMGELCDQEILNVEGNLQIETQGCYIRGKYDLVTKSPGGKLDLWDWKTGKMPKPTYFSSFQALKAQLGIYAIWMRYAYETESVCGTAVFLRDGIDTQSEVFTPSVEQDVLEYMGDWRDKLNAMRSYPSSPGPLCDWCSWNEDCP